ncbi:unnamed protein product, partial [Symbiodinium pilosum]
MGADTKAKDGKPDSKNKTKDGKPPGRGKVKAKPQKTIFCMFNFQGVCKFSAEDCIYAHSLEEMRGARCVRGYPVGGQAGEPVAKGNLIPNAPQVMELPPVSTLLDAGPPSTFPPALATLPESLAPEGQSLQLTSAPHVGARPSKEQVVLLQQAIAELQLQCEIVNHLLESVEVARRTCNEAVWISQQGVQCAAGWHPGISEPEPKLGQRAASA